VPGELSHATSEVVLRMARERGLSVNALAKAAGLPQTTLARRLSNHASLDVDDLEGIARALGLTPHELLEFAEQ